MRGSINPLSLTSAALMLAAACSSERPSSEDEPPFQGSNIGAMDGGATTSNPNLLSEAGYTGDITYGDAGAFDAAIVTDAIVGNDATLRPDATIVNPDSVTWVDPAPRAKCRPSDKPDDKLSGLNGDYRCNLDVIGEVAAPHFLSLAWYKDCAYVNGPDGTSVVHVAADGKPTVTTVLTEIGFRGNWETMKASEQSGMLVGYESNGSTLAVYDVSKDCTKPEFQSSTRLGGLLGSIGHAGSLSPDGTIYYASSMYTTTVFAVELKAPKDLKVISSAFPRGAHDLFIGKQGKRGYFAQPNVAAVGTGGLAIIDTSQVEARAADAKGTLLKELSWEDGSISQYPVAFSSSGRDYLMITDELGSGNCDNPKKPQWGYARIFDIQDEQNPKLVSLIKTEAQDPKNCKAAGDANGGTAGFGLGTHYCNVDRLENARVLMCGNWDAGLRVYDIRDPYHPQEVAYFDTPSANMPGLARLIPEKREIWIAVTPSVVAAPPGTFYVLKIPSGTPLDQLLAQ